MKYIDLFSGIGGFRIALDNLKHNCVFSSEIDIEASKIYFDNFGENPLSDITKIKNEDIPKHEILLAGFPCQSFSKAGQRKGFLDTRGTLFFEIERILKYHNTKYVLLENVQSLITHDSGNTFKKIKNILIELGYITTKEPLIVSPTSFGVPQIRKRLIIPAIKKDLLNNKIDYLKIPIPEKQQTNINSIVIDNLKKKKNLMNIKIKFLMHEMNL